MDLGWQPVTGAAQRRRGRRLRASWRHEKQSTAQALATFTHHPAPRGQTGDGMGRRGGAQGHARCATATEAPSSPAGALQPLRRRARREAACQPGRAARPQVEQLSDLSPMVQILDAPVPQAVNQLVDAFRHIDIPLPEQVIEVPELLCPARPRCMVPRWWWNSW